MDYNSKMGIARKKIGVIVLTLVVILAGALSLPPVWSRVTYHSREFYRTVKYWIKPPNEAIFVPSTSNDGLQANSSSFTLTANPPAASPSAEPTRKTIILPTTVQTQSVSEITVTPNPSLMPTSIPFPPSVILSGIHPERQLMNNCGPATLSMNLSFYDWGKDQIAVGGVLRPNEQDVNVMPYELVDFVTSNTALNALWRYGGDLQTIKALLNAGFPVMIEKSFEPYSLRNEGWMGHYNLVVGYDDERQTLTVQDSYLMSYPPWGGEIPQELWDEFIGFDFFYKELERAWRAFNDAFIVVYLPEDENNVLDTLGPLANSEEACRRAYDGAMQETTSLTDVRDQFFAWFNTGTSLVCLEDYENAATAFDTAFDIYPDIPKETRPFRILWYETGPYIAYYNSGRYQDVIDLADQTLGSMAEPALEESYYWRALAYVALGDTTRAKNDLRNSLKYHPGFAAGETLLKQLIEIP